MRSSLEKFWTLLFVALVQLPVAGVVSGLVGAQTGLPFWVMGIAAHLQVRLATDLSLGRRVVIWSAAVTAGGITGGFLAIAISLLTRAAPTLAVSLSMQALFTLATADSALSIPSWTGVFAVAILTAISFAPVTVAWAVSRILVRRSARRVNISSPPVTPRRGTDNPEKQIQARPTQASERQRAPQATNRMLREASWFVGCAVVVGTVLVIFIAAEVVAWADVDWTAVTAVVFSVFGLVTLVRAVAWLIRGGGRRLRYWPESVLIAGVCLLAYGGSGVIDADRYEDSDRYLATIGAGLTITGTLIRRRLAAK